MTFALSLDTTADDYEEVVGNALLSHATEQGWSNADTDLIVAAVGVQLDSLISSGLFDKAGTLTVSVSGHRNPDGAQVLGEVNDWLAVQVTVRDYRQPDGGSEPTGQENTPPV